MAREEAIEYFKFRRKIFCEDYLKICPKDSIAYQATLKEKEFYDMAIKALEQEPCDCISRKCSDGETTQPNYKALKIISETMMDMVNNKPFEEVMGNLENNMREMGIEVPILKEQEPFNAKPKTGHCKDCKWWKDSDGVFRRGIGAESQCPMNHIEVFEGNGYCYMFEPQESEDKE